MIHFFSFHRLAASICASFVFACAPAHTRTGFAADPPHKPNVILLMADDWRADALGCAGHPVVRTPNIDALAARGFRFDAAYCLGSDSGAVCRPSRNMFLSGKAYFRWRGPDAPAKGDNFPNTLKQAGYETWHCGKRGNTAIPIQACFEHNSYINENAERTGGHPGKAITDQAIEFLGKRDAQRPFFLYCGFETPHDPRVPTNADRDHYKSVDVPLPKNFLPQHPFDNGEMIVRDEKLLPWPREKKAMQDQLREYYGAMTGLDREIGRIIAALKQAGQLENTIIIFSSDHGLAMGSHGLLGKQSLYEDAMRVPLIFAGPGIPHGESAALAYLLDIYPTVCGLTTIDVPPNLDGRDLAPIIAGKKAQVRDSLMTAYRDVQRAVRDERWKLIRYPQIDKTQLFDLKNDPDEMHDLADAAEHRAVRERLTAKLADWQQLYEDETPLTVAKPKPSAFVPPAGKTP